MLPICTSADYTDVFTKIITVEENTSVTFICASSCMHHSCWNLGRAHCIGTHSEDNTTYLSLDNSKCDSVDPCELTYIATLKRLRGNQTDNSFYCTCVDQMTNQVGENLPICYNGTVHYMIVVNVQSYPTVATTTGIMIIIVLIIISNLIFIPTIKVEVMSITQVCLY